MSKKIKITEEQLKRLMVLKEENQELESTEYEDMGEDENSDNELDRMVDSFIRQYKERAIQGVDEDMVNGLCDKIRQGLSGEESQSKYEMPGYQETMDNLNNLSIREDESDNEEKYFARHGDEPWTGSSNKIYGGLPDGDYDDESYDDFDTLHSTHPNFHKHYTSTGDSELAKSMFYRYNQKYGPLRMKRIKQMDTQINESVQKIKSTFKRFL